MTDALLKLSRLSQLDNLALFRWSSSTKRIGGKFIPLSEIRLNILSSNAGVVHFSMSAPVLFMLHGRPQIRFYDADVFRVVDGDRKNINILHSHVRNTENVVEIRNIMHLDCTEAVNDMVANKIVSIGGSLSYPVMQLVMPDMFRITNSPETLRPLYNKELLALIGADPDDSADTLRKKFVQHIDLFGYKTDDGYVVNNKCIASGGMVCVTSEGISRTSGSPVFQIPLNSLDRQLKELNWGVHTVEENSKDELEGQDTGAK